MKIWFYYAKSGGGHKAPAEALASEFRKLYPEEKIKLVDLADRAELFFRYAIEGGYVFIVHQIPWFYSLIYIINNWRPVVRIENKIIDYFVKPSIKAKLVLDRPDGIVATHFFVSPLISAMRELNISIPITMIVTEPFSVSPTWFHFPKINYVVFSDEAKAIALREGVPADNVEIFQPIVNHMALTLDENETALIKEKYGLTPGKKIILIIGGANGLPQGEKIFLALLKEQIDAEFVVVCGDNKRCEGRMRTLSDRYPKRAVILGFVKNIAELIAIANLVIGKAGAGVVFETLLNQKPLLITHYIYGQEKGTMEFVVKKNLGWYEPRPSRIAQKVRECLSQEELDRVMKAHQMLGLTAGNHEVANYLFRTFTKRQACPPAA